MPVNFCRESGQITRRIISSTLSRPLGELMLLQVQTLAMQLLSPAYVLKLSIELSHLELDCASRAPLISKGQGIDSLSGMIEEETNKRLSGEDYHPSLSGIHLPFFPHLN